MQVLHMLAATSASESPLQPLFDFLVKLFGLGTVETNPDFFNKLATYFTGAVLTVMIMAVVVLILIITVAVLAVKNHNKKNKLKDSSQVLEDNAELRNRIRNEIEPIIRNEVENEYKDKMPASGVTDEQYERLKSKLDDKDAQIKELGRALEQANAATHAISANANSSEMSKTVADLTLQNSLLTEQNNQYHNEINDLQEEIQRLKEQEGKQQVAAEKAKQKAVAKAKADVAKEAEMKAAKEKAAQEKAAAKEAEMKAKKEAQEKAKAEKAAADKEAREKAKAEKAAADKEAKEKAKAEKAAQEKALREAAEKIAKEIAEKTAKETAEKVAEKTAKEAAATQMANADEDDEYDNEFGDENSEVKVTLKFDEDKGDWVVERTDMNRAYRRLPTKAEALPIARDLAKRLQAQLIVHNKDGKLSYNI
ncbi:MAG: DUF2188 domain-containing protein [Clostridiales bacterium]|nr:DUF2188 domain-containing protein [Clostridiales bacterium]